MTIKDREAINMVFTIVLVIISQVFNRIKFRVESIKTWINRYYIGAKQ